MNKKIKKSFQECNKYVPGGTLLTGDIYYKNYFVRNLSNFSINNVHGDINLLIKKFMETIELHRENHDIILLLENYCKKQIDFSLLHDISKIYISNRFASKAITSLNDIEISNEQYYSIVVEFYKKHDVALIFTTQFPNTFLKLLFDKINLHANNNSIKFATNGNNVNLLENINLTGIQVYCSFYEEYDVVVNKTITNVCCYRLTQSAVNYFNNDLIEIMNIVVSSHTCNNYLRQILDNCPNIYFLTVKINCSDENCYDIMRELLNIISQNKQIRKLCIETRLVSKKNKKIFDELLCEYLKYCGQSTIIINKTCTANLTGMDLSNNTHLKKLSFDVTSKIDITTLLRIFESNNTLEKLSRCKISMDSMTGINLLKYQNRKLFASLRDCYVQRTNDTNDQNIKTTANYFENNEIYNKSLLERA